ncbi:MAG TPA: phage portal protein [Allosphingosinicella sp.]
MSIWHRVYGGSIRGGWRTHGPGSDGLVGALDSGSDGAGEATVNAESAMRLSAFHACISLRAEIIGSLPLHLRDANKNVVRDHPLSLLLSVSPNANQTKPEFWSLATAMQDIKGNSVSIIERIGKKPVALTPVDPDDCSFDYNKSGSRKVWTIGKEKFNDDDILHLRGFSLKSDWGTPRLELGRHILQAQLTANNSALRAFRQGLKVGGFFVNEGTRDLGGPELAQFAERLNFFGRPENAGKWMTLLKGLKPIAGTEFSVKPADAQLLESRYFGIEEICRLCSVPPQLIGHTNKASSWASSIENVNLFFLMYSIQPTLIRNEASITKKLLTPEDFAKGISPKFNIRGLLRSDMKTQTLMFASALQNGYYNQDEVRDFLDEPPLPNGEGKVYRVQLNMAGAADNALGANNEKGDD